MMFSDVFLPLSLPHFWRRKDSMLAQYFQMMLLPGTAAKKLIADKVVSRSARACSFPHVIWRVVRSLAQPYTRLHQGPRYVGDRSSTARICEEIM